MAHAHLLSGKNNDSNYVETETAEFRRGRQLQLYLEDELVRISKMQTRFARELVSNSDFFKPDYKCGKYSNDFDLILAVGKDMMQTQVKLTRLYMHACLIKKDQEEKGRDETDWKPVSQLSLT